jgi:hypothetical protein
MIRLHKMESPQGTPIYRVSARRIPRGYVEMTRAVVEHRGGDGRYEAWVNYTTMDAWTPRGLEGSWYSRLVFGTLHEAVEALLSHECFTEPFRGRAKYSVGPRER